jgi:hypothetical protein
VLEDPGAGVMDEHGVEASGERGVDVGLGAVADHPGGVGREFVFGDDGVVGGGVLLGRNLDGGEVGLDAGALEFVGLLGVVALGDEDEAMARGELGRVSATPASSSISWSMTDWAKPATSSRLSAVKWSSAMARGARSR